MYRINKVVLFSSPLTNTKVKYRNNSTLEVIKKLHSEILDGFDYETPKFLPIQSVDEIAKCSQETEQINKRPNNADYFDILFCCGCKSFKHASCGTFSCGPSVNTLDITNIKVTIPIEVWENGVTLKVINNFVFVAIKF